MVVGLVRPTLLYKLIKSSDNANATRVLDGEVTISSNNNQIQMSLLTPEPLDDISMCELIEDENEFLIGDYSSQLFESMDSRFNYSSLTSSLLSSETSDNIDKTNFGTI